MRDDTLLISYSLEMQQLQDTNSLRAVSTEDMDIVIIRDSMITEFVQLA